MIYPTTCLLIDFYAVLLISCMMPISSIIGQLLLTLTHMLPSDYSHINNSWFYFYYYSYILPGYQWTFYNFYSGLNSWEQMFTLHKRTILPCVSVSVILPHYSTNFCFPSFNVIWVFFHQNFGISSFQGVDKLFFSNLRHSLWWILSLTFFVNTVCIIFPLPSLDFNKCLC